MVSIPVKDRNGNEVGTYEVDPAEFAPTVNRQLLHDAVVMYEANRRQGSHKTKSRGQVAGSCKKMYRQKGTGNARAGSRRSGVRRSGGHIHAIRNRDYSYRLTRKALQLATRMAIAAKLGHGEVVVLDELAFGEPKTKEMATILQNLGLGGARLLVATEEYDPNVYKSIRNIARVDVAPARELNARAVLGARTLVVTRAALDCLREKAKESPAAPAE